jgi:hypothetical protein
MVLKLPRLLGLTASRRSCGKGLVAAPAGALNQAARVLALTGARCDGPGVLKRLLTRSRLYSCMRI